MSDEIMRTEFEVVVKDLEFLDEKTVGLRGTMTDHCNPGSGTIYMVKDYIVREKEIDLSGLSEGTTLGKVTLSPMGNLDGVSDIELEDDFQ